MSRALLVIDIQREYFPGGLLPLWEAEETEARIITAIGRARDAGDKIILVQHLSAATTGLFATGSAGSELRPEIIAAVPQAPVVVKQYADSFQDTTLAEHLTEVTELLVCGMMTQNCVVFTALSRSAEHLKVSVVGDLCAAPTEAVHRIAINALRSKTQVIFSVEVWASKGRKTLTHHG